MDPGSSGGASLCVPQSDDHCSGGVLPTRCSCRHARLGQYDGWVTRLSHKASPYKCYQSMPMLRYDDNSPVFASALDAMMSATCRLQHTEQRRSDVCGVSSEILHVVQAPLCELGQDSCHLMCCRAHIAKHTRFVYRWTSGAWAP